MHDLVAVAELHGRNDALTAQERAVAAVQVLEDGPPSFYLDAGVVARHAGVVDPDPGLGGAPEDVLPGRSGIWRSPQTRRQVAAGCARGSAADRR